MKISFWWTAESALNCILHAIAPSRTPIIAENHLQLSLRTDICLYHRPTWLLSKLFTASLVCLAEFSISNAPTHPIHTQHSATANVSRPLMHFKFSTTMRCYYEIDWEIYLDIRNSVHCEHEQTPVPSSASSSSVRLLFFLLSFALVSKTFPDSLTTIPPFIVHRRHCHPPTPHLALSSRPSCMFSVVFTKWNTQNPGRWGRDWKGVVSWEPFLRSTRFCWFCVLWSNQMHSVAIGRETCSSMWSVHDISTHSSRAH